MILDAWKPKTKVINGKQTIVYYNKLDDINNLNTNVRVRWVCDNIDCKTPNKIHSISVGHLDEKKSKHNTLKKQICHSCQMYGENNPMFGNEKSLRELMNDDKKYFTLIDKYKKRWSGDNNISHREDVKKKKNQFIINKNNLSKLLNKKSETLLSYTGTNKTSLLTIKCKNNHIRTQRYCSLIRGHGCIECFWESLNIPIEQKNNYELYRKLVYRYTRMSLRNFNDTINPKKLKRGNKNGEYHLDHKFSISEGFKNNIPPFIIGSQYNLEYIPNKENLSKLSGCSITINDLYDIYYKNINNDNFRKHVQEDPD
jgi:hypothetical protein